MCTICSSPPVVGYYSTLNPDLIDSTQPTQHPPPQTRQAHRAFESFGLQACLELGMAMLGQALNDALQMPAPAPLDAAVGP